MDELIDQSKEKEKKKREELRRNRELSDIRKVLSTAEGRRWYWRVMSTAGAFHTPFTGDNNLTNHNCGKQIVGFFLLDELLEATPATLVQMQREAKSEAKKQQDEEQGD
jgi:hypothetical protein